MKRILGFSFALAVLGLIFYRIVFYFPSETTTASKSTTITRSSIKPTVTSSKREVAPEVLRDQNGGFLKKFEAALTGKTGKEQLDAAEFLISKELKNVKFVDGLNCLQGIGNTTIYWECVKALIRVRSTEAVDREEILDWVLETKDLPLDLIGLGARMAGRAVELSKLTEKDLFKSQEFTAGFFQGAGRRKFEEIAPLLEKVKPSGYTSVAYENLVISAVNVGTTATARQVYAWAHAIDSGQTRNELQGSALYKWSQTEPTAAAAEALQLIANNDPGASNAAASIVSGWTEFDELAASQWVTTLPVGDAKDSASLQLVRLLKNKSPKDALVWAESISGVASKKLALDLLK